MNSLLHKLVLALLFNLASDVCGSSLTLLLQAISRSRCPIADTRIRRAVRFAKYHLVRRRTNRRNRAEKIIPGKNWIGYDKTS